ncbi:MAG: hypothetical protein NTX49_03935 [Chlamydiae bacterium]|nr:hypothetical protein [Chlamydiota bacterium]
MSAPSPLNQAIRNLNTSMETLCNNGRAYRASRTEKQNIQRLAEKVIL